MTQSSSTQTDTQPLLILVDGHSLAFRSYFAFARNPLRTKAEGIPTSVCFGFLKALIEVMTKHNPEYMAVAFDLGLPTFRHEADDTYKADRPGTPEDFIPDMKNLHELLAGFNLPVVTSPGYEADDVLATLAKQGSEAGYRVKIVTGDRDLFQVIDTDKAITVLYLGNDAISRSNAGPIEFEPEQVEAKLGILPSQVVDYKALCGDKSDNIPGVRGIGEKTAVQLLKDYGSLENVYASLDKIKGATKTKLENGKQEAEHSQYLAQLKFDAPVHITLEDCKLKGFDTNLLKPLLEKLEFQTYLGRIDQLQKRFGGTVETPQPKEEIQENPANENPTATKNPIVRTYEDPDLWFFSAEDTKKAQKQEPRLIEPQIIDTSTKLKELIKELKRCTSSETPTAWDTETSDLEPRDAELVGIGCCFSKDNNVVVNYIPIGHKNGTNLDKEEVLNALRPILESKKYPKALQNAKFDRLVFRCQEINLAGVIFDTMLASYVLNPNNSHNLSELSMKYLGITAKSYNELVPKGQTIADIDIPLVADYCGMDVYTTFYLVDKLRTELDKSPDLHKLLLEVELPLEPVLAAMEYQGFNIDVAYLNQFSQQLEKDLQRLEEQAYEAAGETFSLGSPKQLSQLLFEKLNLDIKKSRKTKTGYSTDAATLEKLQGDHPVVDAVLEYRTLSKLKSTYVDALPLLVRSDTHRVHTNFNQTGTTTGRLSSSDPNLQNIPIRTAFSRQIRKAFIPEKNWLLAAADYSQIELRILAHLTKEPILVETYKNNEDVHKVTARLLFEKEDVTSDERRLGKTINFGVIYGMGAARFAREASVSTAQGRTFIERFNQRYPKVFAYLQELQKQAIAQGYVTTILGRRRYFDFTNHTILSYRGNKLDDINLSKLKQLGPVDAGLLRAAANAPIQGSSADIIKIAMRKLHELLQNYQTRLLLQVHDELIFEVFPDEWEELQPKIKHTMESAVKLDVPLLVEVHAGQNWMDAK